MYEESVVHSKPILSNCMMCAIRTWTPDDSCRIRPGVDTIIISSYALRCQREQSGGNKIAIILFRHAWFLNFNHARLLKHEQGFPNCEEIC